MDTFSTCSLQQGLLLRTLKAPRALVLPYRQRPRMPAHKLERAQGSSATSCRDVSHSNVTKGGMLTMT